MCEFYKSYVTLFVAVCFCVYKTCLFYLFRFIHRFPLSQLVKVTHLLGLKTIIYFLSSIASMPLQ